VPIVCLSRTIHSVFPHWKGKAELSSTCLTPIPSMQGSGRGESMVPAIPSQLPAQPTTAKHTEVITSSHSSLRINKMSRGVSCERCHERSRVPGAHSGCNRGTAHQGSFCRQCLLSDSSGTDCPKLCTWQIDFKACRIRHAHNCSSTT